MRYAIMSDVHANPAALEAALKDAHAQGCGRFVMLGDTTGYGYDVKTAIKLVRSQFDVVLMGNHDSACLGREPAWETEANPHYHQDLRQSHLLSERETAWLGKRPYLHFEAGAAFAHGTYIRPEEWGYIIDSADARRNFCARPERLMFCGHTHAATVWTFSPKEVCEEKKLFDHPVIKAESKGFKLKKGFRYIVNVGSVGYPRHDLCSTYVIWDDEADRMTFRRLPFDFKGYIQAMMVQNVDLPGWLLELLIAIAQ